MNVRVQARYQKPFLRRLGSTRDAVHAGLPTDAELAALVCAAFPEQLEHQAGNGTVPAGAIVLLATSTVKAAPPALAM
jgi:hypothetical protein